MVFTCPKGVSAAIRGMATEGMLPVRIENLNYRPSWVPSHNALLVEPVLQEPLGLTLTAILSLLIRWA